MALNVGQGSHMLEFYHPSVKGQYLRVHTGMDEISWGYALNTADWYTYGGQVVQILSCYVDDVTITGTLQTYKDMEDLYGYFIEYMQIASQGVSSTPKPGVTSFNQQTMKMRYPHRGWEFDVIVTQAPGFRYGRDVVAPSWRVMCHIADESQDVEELSDLIVNEVIMRDEMGGGSDFNTSFKLTGKIGFTDENPFSDPFTEKGVDFSDKALSDRVNELAQWYNDLLPSYLEGDFDSITSSVGSKPAFGTRGTPSDPDQDPNGSGTAGQKKKADKIRNGQ